MNTKLFTFQNFKDIPSQFLCQMCCLIKSKLGFVDKQANCYDCLQLYQQTTQYATSMIIYFYYHSTCICNICNKSKRVDKYQKHFIKCSESWQTTKLIQDNYIIDMNKLKQCECLNNINFACSRQCNQCFIILCQSCQFNHQDCNLPNYQNYIAQCKREQCLTLIQQDQLVTHALKCEFRERMCNNNCEWKGIQRDYKNHAEHCHREPSRLCRESNHLNRLEFYQIQSQKRFIQFKTNKTNKQILKLKEIQIQQENS